MNTNIHPKTAGATVGAALSTLIIWGLGVAHIAVPVEVTAALPVLLSFLGGYLPGSPAQ